MILPVDRETGCDPVCCRQRMRTLPSSAFVALAMLMSVTAFAAVGSSTRFDYVAVFPAGTDATLIEGWRAQVLGRPHVHPCLRDRPCVARMMRLALPGVAGSEVIAFDLMREIEPAERAALVAASDRAIPGTRLHADSRPIDIQAGRSPVLP